ncbi:hypothetical protein J1614_003139 [Plenodomus biglobosus]|nr:hypothetical protein J1614_003139 [Plenodomus biglobosus]
MSQAPDDQTPKHPNEDPHSAYSLLQGLKAHGMPVKPTPTPGNPRPYPPSYSSKRLPTQTTSGIPRASGSSQYHARPLTDPQHAAHLLVSHNTFQLADDQQLTGEQLTPDSITREMIQARLAELLESQIPSFNSYAITKIAIHLTQVVISAGQSGKLGPRGLSKLTDIFTSIGHEGKKHYMCIAISAPGAGHVQVLLMGDLCEKEGLDPLLDDELMEMCRKGLEDVARRMYESLVPVPGTNHAMRWM